MKNSKSLIFTRSLMALSVIGLSLLCAFDLQPVHPVLAAELEHDAPGGLADGRFGVNNINRAWVVAEEVILSERRVEAQVAPAGVEGVD